MVNNHWLVVWNMNFMDDFSIYIGMSSSQLTFAYFSEGSTTNDRTQDTSAVQLLEMAKARLAKAR
jgi:hypothetical protein